MMFRVIAIVTVFNAHTVVLGNGEIGIFLNGCCGAGIVVKAAQPILFQCNRSAGLDGKLTIVGDTVIKVIAANDFAAIFHGQGTFARRMTRRMIIKNGKAGPPVAAGIYCTFDNSAAADCYAVTT